jgi:hypothetical protein
VLRNLQLSYNLLTTLDVSTNTALTNIQCWNNKLTALDVSTNTALTSLYINSNLLTDASLNTLFGTLNTNAVSKIIYIRGNPGTGTCNKNIAIDQGWTVDTSFWVSG